ncbi:MAG: gamma-glutamyl-gamma-aminobutyrate hydrolase family protein [Clostridia bacterium]|nr:gamma-glutamyl-gamma-aminobutyrate hydrolase family protein [Clostridia bacterium]
MKIATLVREMHVEPLDSIFSPRMYLSMDLYTMAKELDFELVAIISGQDCEEICKLCDGLIVPGSAKDIDPKYYGGEAMDPPQQIDEYALDAKVIDLFVKQGKPIFGICGGHQDLNIYFGGSISKIDYDPHQDENKYHEVIAEKDSFVYDVFGSTDILVNSHHGWAIDRLAPNLRVVARSKKDNVIDAVEDRERKIFATQWHPELSYRMGDPIEKKFFENFIRLCANK